MMTPEERTSARCACCGEHVPDGAGTSNPHGTLESMRQGETLCSACFAVRLDALCARGWQE